MKPPLLPYVGAVVPAKKLSFLHKGANSALEKAAILKSKAISLLNPW